MSVSEQPTITPVEPAGKSRRDWKSTFASAEVDTRLIGMLVALAVIWIGFHALSAGNFYKFEGQFITSRNLWNLFMQSTSIGIMATGMVLIIVSRNIDLSVGSLLGFLGYTMALVQTDKQISVLGYSLTLDFLNDNRWAIWIVALVVGLLFGLVVGALQGSIIAYLGVPAFIVTLGGYLAWRGLIFRTGDKQGQTLAPLDDKFRALGGAPERSMGEWRTWLVAVLVCIGIVASIYLARRRRQKYDLGVRPLGWDIALAVLGVGAVLLGVWLIAIKYPSPSGEPTGLAYPVLILMLVTMLMTYVARRRRFGRYVYAYGGNPEAAELGGINTRRTIMYTYMVMGMLVAVSASIQTARLNSATTNLGVQNELYVIAAAVIGGTSFAGGIGTIPGAVLGAVVMQSLRSGMSLLNIDSPSQDIVVGIVLVTAVAIDSLLRMHRRKGVIGTLVVGVLAAAFIIQTGLPEDSRIEIGSSAWIFAGTVLILGAILFIAYLVRRKPAKTPAA